MGRDAGFHCIACRLAGGADVILILKFLFITRSSQRKSAGASPVELISAFFPLPKVPAAGQEQVYAIRGIRFMPPGGRNWQSGGSPSHRRGGFENSCNRSGAFTAWRQSHCLDRSLATRFGSLRYAWQNSGGFGGMVAIQGTRIVDVSLDEALTAPRRVDLKVTSADRQVNWNFIRGYLVKSREPPEAASFLGLRHLTKGSEGLPKPDVYNYYPSSTSPPVLRMALFYFSPKAKSSIAQFQSTVKLIFLILIWVHRSMVRCPKKSIRIGAQRTDSQAVVLEFMICIIEQEVDMQNQFQRHMGLKEWILNYYLSMFWGGSFFFSKVALSELRPFTIVLARVSLAAIVLNCVLVITGQRLPTSPKRWLEFAIMEP